MLDPAIAKLLQEDRRYPLEAYVFVFEGLQYAQDVLGMGSEVASEQAKSEEGPQRHVTGQELCHAIRQFALEQYGYMAKLVLGNWGLHTTGDFGEIVFNLIRIGRMRKTPQDRREDFDDVYDFDRASARGFASKCRKGNEFFGHPQERVAKPVRRKAALAIGRSGPRTRAAATAVEVAAGRGRPRAGGLDRGSGGHGDHGHQVGTLRATRGGLGGKFADLPRVLPLLASNCSIAVNISTTALTA